MTDIIHVLPDSVANQIAAGEVIQRPASVVKELVENSIDAGAKNIQVIIKDGGNALIQIVDNGKGMSETDARMSFERHATSKIRQAEDLFSLRTMGFRGEALASVAAVAQVEMRTKREDDVLGTLIEIAGTRVFRQESVQCDTGTNISVKNLFFNVPARRRFLKSQSTEMMHVRNEFFRIVLVHPEISFSLFEDDKELMVLPVSSLKARIENVFVMFSKKRMDQQLLPVEAATSLLNIRGFVGRPEFAQKNAQQYFFVNERYMRHPYFHKAVMVAYEKLIKPGENPNYFIYFDIDPNSIDVNVHPSKTEIKFDNEQAVWSIILATVKEALGKFQVMPPLDFDQEDSPDIPVLDKTTRIVPPRINFDPNYNPFGKTSTTSKRPDYDWEKLYDDFNKNKEKGKAPSATANTEWVDAEIPIQQQLEITDASADYLQFKLKYILTSVKSGLMLIDQHRAHFRVLFDRYMLIIRNQKGVSQQMLFPEVLELETGEVVIIERILPELLWIGFDIENFGKNAYVINGIPAEMGAGSVLSLLKELIAEVQLTELSVSETIQEKIASVMARKTAIQYGKSMTLTEMTHLFQDLFSCDNHQYAPDGKPIITVLLNEEIEKRFR
ncbi:MAG TPA: DNA mismatch repair endonuclease MutL [Paludibacteraceae bacterium]|nr:DNA mismatch repair endonuclease MutL [Paludibacteraceae bacterium]